MAEYFDISHWNDKPWYGTKGSRNKSVVENPETGVNCYFKTSLLKENKDYKHEFWSEIIASEIGQFLQYNILKYDIAFHKTEMGCISEFMNTEGESELTEGIQYLTGYDTAYKPNTKESKKEYTFQFICDALKSFDFKDYISELIRIIVFDSLIGNGDRHQENWGIITYNKEALELYRRESKNRSHRLINRLYFRLLVSILKHFPNISKKAKIKLHSLLPNVFAPIYDSGSCLCRELLDNKVGQLLKDEQQLKAYIRRGTSEIHWEGEKISHFDLIRNIHNQYPEEIDAEIRRIESIFNETEIASIVDDVDKHLPEDKMQFCLPEDRKELIFKVVSLRYKELIKILN